MSVEDDLALFQSMLPDGWREAEQELTAERAAHAVTRQKLERLREAVREFVAPHCQYCTRESEEITEGVGCAWWCMQCDSEVGTDDFPDLEAALEVADGE